MWNPFTWLRDKCRRRSHSSGLDDESRGDKALLDDERDGQVEEQKVQDDGSSGDDLSQGGSEGIDDANTNKCSSHCSIHKEPWLTATVVGNGLMIYAAGLGLQDPVQWFLQIANIPLDENCTSEGGLPSYTLSIVALGSGAVWLGIHIPSLIQQRQHAKRPAAERREKAISIQAKGPFEALFRGYEHVKNGRRVRASSALMVALAWSQIPGDIQDLIITQLPNATLHNETAILIFNQNYAIFSTGSFLLFLGLTAVNHVYVHKLSKEHGAAVIYRRITDFMAVVSLPLLLPEYLNDLLNLVPGYDSQALPTIASAFGLAGVVGLAYGGAKTIPALRKNHCLSNMLGWFNVDLLNSLSGAPYLWALVGTLAQCSTPGDEHKPMLTQGVGILITALAATVMLVWLVATIVQCFYRKPAQQQQHTSHDDLHRSGSINGSVVSSTRATTFGVQVVSSEDGEEKSSEAVVVLDDAETGEGNNNSGLPANI
jgi:hypothetical protein